MGRATQFIDYINKKHEPDPMSKACEYTHFSFREDIFRARKNYRKIIKKGDSE